MKYSINEILRTQNEFPYLSQEPEDEYHSKRGDFLSSHLLGDFRKSPLLYQKKITGLIKDEDRPAYKIGRAAHKLILEGSDAFSEAFAIGGPINPKTGKPYGIGTQKYEEWQKEQGKPAISDDQFDLIRNLAIGVAINENAGELLGYGIPERVARENLCGIPCQIRMDWFNPDKGIIDLKTCEDLTWFEADAKRFGYIHQAAFYRSVLEAASGKQHDFYFVAVEKREPFRCGVWKVSKDVLSIAQKENEDAIGRLIKSKHEDVWPTGYEDIRSLNYL